MIEVLEYERRLYSFMKESPADVMLRFKKSSKNKIMQFFKETFPESMIPYERDKKLSELV